MTKRFKDHFSNQSDHYNAYRPQYPPELFHYLASICCAQQAAWDCATGTGQSALMLARYFKYVVATDASRAQLDHARQHARVSYRLASAEKSGLSSDSLDLITVSQALHWFDIESFVEEADRVLCKHGVLSAWTYNLLKVNDPIDAILISFYRDMLGQYWPKERLIVERNYGDIHLPFELLTAPEFTMTARWDMSQLIGYMNTWSATKRFEKAKGVNPVEQIKLELESAWGDRALKRDVYWPLTIKIWRK